jgi:hypothetical protein
MNAEEHLLSEILWIESESRPTTLFRDPEHKSWLSESIESVKKI